MEITVLVACLARAMNQWLLGHQVVTECLNIYHDLILANNMVKEEILDKLKQLVLVWILKVIEFCVKLLKFSPSDQLIFDFLLNILCVILEDNSHFSKHLCLKLSLWHFESWDSGKNSILVM
mgnify:CR=1 FL=1